MSYWNYRWNPDVIRRDSVSDPKIGDLEMKVVQLERIVSYLLVRLLRGEPVSARDRIVREFLNLSDLQDDDRALSTILGQLVEPLGLLTCPQCGAKIRDVPGVTDERCHWCGALVGSNR